MVGDHYTIDFVLYRQSNIFWRSNTFEPYLQFGLGSHPWYSSVPFDRCICHGQPMSDKSKSPSTHHIQGLHPQQSNLAIEVLQVARIYSYAHSIFVLILERLPIEIWLCILQLCNCQSKARGYMCSITDLQHV